MVVGHTTEEGIRVDTATVIRNWWPDWIPVEERLPEDQSAVLVSVQNYKDEYWITRGVCVQNEERSRNRWFVVGTYNENVTHWMPLPNPPKI
jgi:hypothetical protein